MTGEELKKRRLEAGMTQQRLADLAGVNWKQVQRYENGQIADLSKITVTTAERLAWALKIPVEWFADKRAYQVGIWWNNQDIQLWRIGPAVYALDGWNGEVYLHCWKCTGDYLMDASKEEYEVRPVYRFEAENIDLDALEEGSDEWERACEIVDYHAE